ncbi:hypothetical protein, partial [Clostridioides difficile]|uniref:hypothetical protein n=1 Tax=Clostridioides difficile TaxID=1496 RepID=UPI0011425CCE
PIFFVTGIAFGLSKKEKGWGALGGIVLFIGMHTVISTLLAANILQSYEKIPKKEPYKELRLYASASPNPDAINASAVTVSEF